MTSPHFVTTAAGVTMPGILYGTAWKKQATADLVLQALQQGFRGIDTACQPKHYFEAGVGEGLQRAIQQGVVTREAVYLQTKFTPLNGQDPQRIPYDALAPLSQQIVQSAQQSLSNLATDYVDGLLLHSPLDTLQQTLEAWQTLEQLVQRGWVRQLGISNCYRLDWLQTLHQQAHIKPALLQNRFYADTDYDRELRRFCLQHGMVYQSFWTLTANPHWLSDPMVLSLAGRYQRTAPQVVFRGLSQIGIVPLSGTCNPQHMQDDASLFDFELSQHECAQLREALGV